MTAATQSVGSNDRLEELHNAELKRQAGITRVVRAGYFVNCRQQNVREICFAPESIEVFSRTGLLVKTEVSFH